MTDKQTVSESDILTGLDIGGLKIVTGTVAGFQKDCAFGMHGLKIADAVIALAIKRKAIDLISKKAKKELNPEELAEREATDVYIISVKTIEMAARSTIEKLRASYHGNLKVKWTPEEFEKLTVTIKGKKCKVGVYRTEGTQLVLPNLTDDGRKKQMKSKLKRIVSHYGGQMRGDESGIFTIAD